MKQALKTLFLLLFILTQLAAQTTGPTQPEAAGFAPVSSSDMVNLYTGDFNYNIPLMVVPGPDGGYPINLFYNSNVGMDMAASWVGLGWNLNCGAIQRNLRGLPDDFSGDEIKKTFYTKPSTTIAVNVKTALKKEIFGADISQSFGLYYNNYSGLGLNAGFSLDGISKSEEAAETSSGLGWSLGLSFDSQEGFSLSPRLSYSGQIRNKSKKWFSGSDFTLALGATINSKQGFHDLNTSFSSGNRWKWARGENFSQRLANGRKVFLEKASWATGMSFASSSPIAPINISRTGKSRSFSLAIDPNKPGILPTKEDINVTGTISTSYISDTETEAPAYGAMYLSRKAGENAITDFYRENDGPITRDKVVNPIPVLTYDVFTIQGHGIGGSFRAYQNSVGKLSSPENLSFNTSVGIGGEVGVGSAFKFGADVDISITKSYSGPWKKKSRFQNNLQKYEFDGQQVQRPLFESFYFKMIGESTPMPKSTWAGLDTDEPIAFDIRQNWDVISSKIRALNSHNHESKFLDIERYPSRNPRVNCIEYLTKAEVQNNGNYIVVGSNLVPIDYTNGKDHHLNAISVLKPNGVRYNYDLPAYNYSTIKETFAIDAISGNPKIITDVNGKPLSDFTKPNNGAGEDEFYTREEIPEYAHTFFITSILSQDYVDIKNDGPTDDDLGTYVKFNYEKIPYYKWRFPFKGAYYTKGYESNEEDDKASFQEGEKDLFYVKAIETKTHVAVFETKKIIDSKLHDAEGIVSAQKFQKELESITLYSKSNPNWTPQFYLNPAIPWPTPMQTVHLEQGYDLRPGTPNSDAINQKTLTLNELYFTYQNSSKGENAKYKFSYGEDRPYEDHKQDRWGAYQDDLMRPIGEPDVLVNENPYTYQDNLTPQDERVRNEDAAAWLMNEVTLPSNGKINIEYERDDYAYVQDKEAMNFLEIKGFAEDNLGGYSSDLYKNNLYIYFKSPVKLSNNADVQKIINGIEEIRFRAYVELKGKGSDIKKDYVSGYAEVDRDISNYAGRYSDDIGWVKIKNLKPKKTSTHHLHPIRLAAFQYLRRSRPDLGPNYDISNIYDIPVWVGTNIGSLLNEVSVLITGYYNMAIAKGWAISIDFAKPSYIRLLAPDRKYGGGARVKQITLHSNDLNNREYGQTYSYNLPDGRSSGVAEFEPILGIEESPFTQPVWYNANNDGQKIIFSNEGAFFEEPYAPGLYPSASVGYSRVTVRNLEEENQAVTYAQSGINISEFYTAKDFPTAFKPYGAMLQEYPVKVLIPFIGMQSFNNNGYSMGYSFTLNNAIYGQPKSVATYPYSTGEPVGQPIQRSVYNYQTSASSNKILDNEVTVLRKEGVKENVIMGKTVDFYIDEIEAHTLSRKFGFQPNLNLQWPAILPSIFPSIGINESNTRYLTTTKIIYNNPILESIDQYKDGAKVTTSNLFYDYETGSPIITSVTNEWEEPIYTYSFPAHWTYDEMKGASNNYKARIAISLALQSSPPLYKLMSGTAFGAIPSNLLQEGDEIRFDFDLPTVYHVVVISRTDNIFALLGRNGNAPQLPSTIEYATISKSGFKNLQSTQKGKIISLKDYSDYIIDNSSGLWSNVFKHYNLVQPSFSPTMGATNGNLGSLDLDLCVEEAVDVSYFYIDNNNRKTLRFYFSLPNSECNGEIDLSGKEDSLNSFDFSKFVFILQTYDPNPFFSSGPQVLMRYHDIGHPSHNETFVMQLLGAEECFRCEREPITVLHADATEFSDEWYLNYKDLEDEIAVISPKKITPSLTASLTDILSGTASSPLNPYAYGMKGIWRPKRTYAYLIDRLQSEPTKYGKETQIDIDGEYKEFYWFDWEQSLANIIPYNESYNWRWVNEVTEYNVNGSSKEGMNRMKIFATSLFGYKNHLVTAAASNSRTTDIAFDGFEDYELSPSNMYNGQKGHGNINLSNYQLTEQAHTGKYSLNVGSCIGNSTNCSSKYNLTNGYFTPKSSEKYYISAWTKQEHKGRFPQSKIEVKINGINKIMVVDNTFGGIDGWYKIEGYFETTPAAINSFEVILSSGVDTDNILFDDLRIQLFNSGMETYVYDPSNYRLLATLSNQNFATFYNYDEEGNLVQTKVETEEGTKTISTNRNNIRR